MKRKLAALVLLSVKHWISAALKSLIWTGQPVMAQLPKHPPPWFSVFEPMGGSPRSEVRPNYAARSPVEGRGLSYRNSPFLLQPRIGIIEFVESGILSECLRHETGGLLKRRRFKERVF